MRKAAEIAALLLLLIGAAAASRLFTGSVSTVIPGEVYRSRQLSAEVLEAEAQRLSLRALLNLRGEREGDAWYEQERELLRRLGIAHFDLRLSSTRLPSRQRLRELVALLESAPRPFLLHCSAGVDRSGLVSGLAVLAAGGDLAAARRELGPVQGLLSRSVLPRVLDQYEGWLLSLRERPTPETLRRFAAEGYTPAFYDAQLELVDPPQRVAVGAPTPLRVRALNRSPEAWRFTSGGDTGVHLALRVRSLAPGRDWQTELRGSTPDARLAPRESAELEALLPPLPAAGRYELWLDLVDESQAFFSDMGSEALVLELEAQPREARPL